MTRKNFGIAIFVLLALFAALAGGGCGGSGSGSTAGAPGTLIGTPHGEMAQYLQEKLDSLGGVVLLSAPNGLKADNEALALLRESFNQGQAVALLSADVGEVNVLLDALSVDIDFPESNDHVELFAVRRRGSGTCFFVTHNDDEVVSRDVTGRTITIIGAERDATGSVNVTPTAVENRNIIMEDATVQRTRVQNFISWAKETAAAEVKVSDSSSNLRDLAEAYVWDIDASYQGQTFTIRYTLYSCHSFTNNMDYYFVTQSAQLNPSVLWKWIEKGHVSYPNIYLPEQEGHMRRYLFENYWGETPEGVPLDSSSPQNANNVSTVTSGVSWNLGGSLGFNAQGPTGSLSTGATFSNSQSFSVSDCSINNMSGSGSKDMAKWEYTFANPANGSTDFYYTELKDAPLLSRSNFQPVNQWVWTVPRSFTDKWDSLKFKSQFTWTNGHSEGQLNCAWIKVEGAKHTDHFWRYLGFWVPVKKPPLMAVSEGQLDFAKAGESKSTTFVSAVDWTASASADWISVQETSGQVTDANGITLHITVSPNDSGANREGTVTLHGGNRGDQTIKVFQSQY